MALPTATHPLSPTTLPPVFLQTFVNDMRIPDQKYVTLKLNDVIRFGYDILPLSAPPSWASPQSPGPRWLCYSRSRAVTARAAGLQSMEDDPRAGLHLLTGHPREY